MSEKPHVYVPPGETPPAELAIEDIEVGDGDEAKPGPLHASPSCFPSQVSFDRPTQVGLALLGKRALRRTHVESRSLRSSGEFHDAG